MGPSAGMEKRKLVCTKSETTSWWSLWTCTSDENIKLWNLSMVVNQVSSQNWNCSSELIYFILCFLFFSFDRWQKYIVRQPTIQEAKQKNSNMTRGVIQATKVEDHGHIYENQKPIGKLQQGYRSVGDYCSVLKRHVGRAKSSLTSSKSDEWKDRSMEIALIDLLKGLNLEYENIGLMFQRERCFHLKTVFLFIKRENWGRIMTIADPMPERSGFASTPQGRNLLGKLCVHCEKCNSKEIYWDLESHPKGQVKNRHIPMAKLQNTISSSTDTLDPSTSALSKPELYNKKSLVNSTFV